MTATAKPTVLTLYQEQIDLLDQVGEEQGIKGRSAVARFIFTDWPKLKRAALHAAAPQSTPAATPQEPPA